MTNAGSSSGDPVVQIHEGPNFAYETNRSAVQVPRLAVSAPTCGNSRALLKLTWILPSGAVLCTLRLLVAFRIVL